MKLDILIKNGLVADPEGHDYINRNIGVIGDRIVDLNTVDDLQAETAGPPSASTLTSYACPTGSPAWSMPAAAAG